MSFTLAWPWALRPQAPALLSDVSIGVALGTNVVTDKATVQADELGIKAGVNLGPALDLPWLLMDFDTDFSDKSPNNFVFADSGSGTMPHPPVWIAGQPFWCRLHDS